MYFETVNQATERRQQGRSSAHLLVHSTLPIIVGLPGHSGFWLRKFMDEYTNNITCTITGIGLRAGRASGKGSTGNRYTKPNLCEKKIQYYEIWWTIYTSLLLRIVSPLLLSGYFPVGDSCLFLLTSQVIYGTIVQYLYCTVLDGQTEYQ